MDEPLAAARAGTKRRKLGAVPVDPDKRTSPWLTAPKAALMALRKVIGKSNYRAYAGVNTGGLNGVHWVRVLREVPDGVLIENLYDVGKIKVARVRWAIEPDLLYPLLRGRDVHRWRAEPSAQIILAQDPETRTGIPEPKMRRRWPGTYAYFKRFERQLRERSAYRKYFDPTDPFYSMYNVGPYSMAPWKLVWREQTATFQASVVPPTADGRAVLPDHKLMLIPCDAHRHEAHYLCAVLNSSPASCLVRSYVLQTSTSTHILEHVAVPKYKANEPLHKKLSQLSDQAHTIAARAPGTRVKDIEAEIDEAAAELWGLTPRELTAVQCALHENERSGPSEPTPLGGEPPSDPSVSGGVAGAGF